MTPSDHRPAAAPLSSTAEPQAGARAWWGLALMTLIYSCHYLDRTVIAIVVEPVRREFSLRDDQIGLLTGLAYGLSFALAVLPLGYLIDRVNRRNLLAVLVFVWSGMTALCGMAQGFGTLLLARIGVGAAEAGGSPTSLSLISDLFPASRRSTAIGVLFLSSGIGALASAVVGAVVAAQYGWRAALLVAGLPGMLLALLLLVTLREPRRGAMEPGRTADDQLQATPALAPSVVFRLILKEPALLHLLAGLSLLTAGIATVGAWLPSFLMRYHGMDLKMASIVPAIVFGVFSCVGTVVGGIVGDRLARTRPTGRLGLCLGVTLLAVPAGLGAMIAPSAPVAVVMSFAVAALTFVTFPNGFSTMLGVVPPGMRGMTAAVTQLCTNLVGYGMGPYVVGLLSQQIGGPDSLRVALSIVVPATLLWGALHFRLALGHQRRKSAMAQASSSTHAGAA
jgi:predicted MFS family arabinose efflux permease